MDIDNRRRVADVVGGIKQAFDENCLTGILADRCGDLSERDLKEFGKGTRIDTRVPAVLARSGKGGQGHEGYVNVCLFDHVSSVAMGAAIFAVCDMIAGGASDEDAASVGAVVFAVGILPRAWTNWRAWTGSWSIPTLLQNTSVPMAWIGFFSTLASP